MRNINVADLVFDEQGNLSEPASVTEAKVNNSSRKSKRIPSRETKSRKVNVTVLTNVNLDTKKRRTLQKTKNCNKSDRLNLDPIQTTFPPNVNLSSSVNNSAVHKNATNFSLQNLLTVSNELPSVNMRVAPKNVKKDDKPVQLKLHNRSNLVDDNPLPLLNDLIIDTNAKKSSKNVSVLLHDGVGNEDLLLKKIQFLIRRIPIQVPIGSLELSIG